MIFFFILVDNKENISYTYSTNKKLKETKWKK